MSGNKSNEYHTNYTLFIPEDQNSDMTENYIMGIHGIDDRRISGGVVNISKGQTDDVLNNFQGVDKLTKKEKDLLSFLSMRKYQLILLKNNILTPKVGDSSFSHIMKGNIENYNKENDIREEIRKKMENYLSELNDDEKYHTFEMLGKYGFTEMVTRDIGIFGEKVKKLVAEQLKKSGNASGVIKNLDKFQGSDKKIAEKLVKKGDK